MKRRDFFKAVGAIVTALGISEFDLFRLSDRYGSALAQSTSRKLALLIGINEYSAMPLNGCVTDVELQSELLIHRFGFQPADIVVLHNQQATRQQIEAAFMQHLVEQAQPGDIVVFHYSGYGRRIQLDEEHVEDQNPQENSELSQPLVSKTLCSTISSLVPVDSPITSSADPIVNDVLEETLWLMLRSLQTENVTTILDTSFYTPPTAPLGNLRIRSSPQIAPAQIHPLELELQQQLIDKIAPYRLLVPPHAALDFPGLFITASQTDQPAAEAQWSGFSAGLFTYALTQSLWEATPATTIHVSLSKATSVVELVGKQQPQLCGQKSQEQADVALHFMPNTDVSADGVVIAVEDNGKAAQLWLAGLQPTLLQYYGVNSRFKVVTPSSGEAGADQAQLQMRSRTGLTAKALLVADNESTNTLQTGQLVQEAIRIVPRNINLNVALDPGLERIERVDATSAFATASFVTLVTSGELADCLFGRIQDDTQSTTASRYGLFTLAHELIPNTAGEAGEAVKVAVQRLIPKLQTLLAAKLWRLTSNETSDLDIQATLEVVSAQKQAIIERETQRFQIKHRVETTTPSIVSTTSGIPSLPIGSRIKYKITNHSDRPVYLLLLGLDSSKNAIVLYPGKALAASGSTDTASIQELAIAPETTISVPRTEIDFEWILHGPPAVCETQLILSRSPFTQTLAALDAAREDLRGEEYISILSNPLEVTQALLRDLQTASAIAPDTMGAAPDTYALDVNAWASFNFIYQVT
ncbi:peptidase C14 caspase catalytic subunit p20 [Gloeocapsa sp. PCC 7428]|uniref:caspase family protein n=1 Tax=Gloeocapsa sp. PCC 7428 TaxID=1173026 RepID=UPI0002A608F3|nr:caspase family protein [Gloeocapsa sp. PCC 7428]AFZ31970.1 peptidase C14 caspase catalytic subunit p20 [Gloeocapsa sp. PCC 7428]